MPGEKKAREIYVDGSHINVPAAWMEVPPQYAKVDETEIELEAQYWSRRDRATRPDRPPGPSELRRLPSRRFRRFRCGRKLPKTIPIPENSRDIARDDYLSYSEVERAACQLHTGHAPQMFAWNPSWLTKPIGSWLLTVLLDAVPNERARRQALHSLPSLPGYEAAIPNVMYALGKTHDAWRNWLAVQQDPALHDLVPAGSAIAPQQAKGPRQHQALPVPESLRHLLRDRRNQR